MKIIAEALCWLTLFLLLVLLSGCTTYYAVRDPFSGNTYYTMEIAETSAGAVRFNDARMNTEIIVYKPEVKKLDSAEYNAALNAPPVPKVKPVGVRSRDESY